MIIFDASTVLPSVLSQADLDQLGRELGRVLSKRARLIVGVRFVTSAQIQELNKTFRGKNRPTDVLSFEAERLALSGEKSADKYLGDLAICASYAKQEAKRRSIEWREELLRLLAHGGLHLLGYDHATQADELKMFAIQEKVLDRLV